MAKQNSSIEEDSKDLPQRHQTSKQKLVIDAVGEKSLPQKALKKHKKSGKTTFKKDSARISHIPPGSPPSSPGAVPLKSHHNEYVQAETKKLSLSPPTHIPHNLVEEAMPSIESSLLSRNEKIQLVIPSPVPSQVHGDKVSDQESQDDRQENTTMDNNGNCPGNDTPRSPSIAPLVVAEPVQALEEEQDEEYVTAQASRQLEERMRTSEWQKRLEQDVEAQLQSKTRVTSVKADKKEESHDDSLFRGFTSRTWGFGVLLLFVAGGLIGVLVAVLSPKTDPNPNPNPFLTLDPTDVPTVSMAPTLSRREYILETLGAKMAPSNSTTEWAMLNDPLTPQGKALVWLTDEDDYSSHPQKLDTQVLLDRYALAVFYFSIANPESLSDEAHFLDGSLAACQWNNGGIAGVDGTQGVHCTDMNQERSVSYMQLESLDLQGNLPWELSLLQNLVALYLDFNAFTGTVPTQIANLSKLQGLFLHYNSLTGPLPVSMPVSMQGLSLAENRLSGSLSSEWASSMTSLNSCLLGNNRIKGPIPSEFGKFSNLWWFDLGDNAITGSIPKELGSLGTSIQHLYLDRNKLTGTLPTEIGNLSKLQRVYVHHNVALSGTVPTEYTRLTNLDMFLFSNTSLVGSVDSIFCDTDDGPLTLWGDCGGTTPEMQCSCCTKCCNWDGGNC